jgi:hypothetical protein
MVIMFEDWAIRSVTIYVRYGEEYDRHSETERVLVNNDRLTTLNWLKIQSDLYGNIEDIIGR